MPATTPGPGTRARLALLAVCAAARAAANQDCYVSDVKLPDWTGVSRCHSLFIGGDNKISDEAQDLLVKRFQNSARLRLKTPQVLVANGKSLSERTLTKLVAQLENNTWVHSLDLTDNGIGDKTAIALGKVLARNNVLKTVTLHGNSVGTEGAAAIARALHKNIKLELLDLGKNSVGNRGARLFADAMGHNVHMRTLVLGANNIGDTGAAALAGAIEWQAREEQGLESLDLTSNRIGPIGGDALADSLLHNARVRVLNLAENEGMPHDVLKQVRKWAKLSSHARELELRKEQKAKAEL